MVKGCAEMPVVKVRLSTLSNSFPSIKLSEILEKLPYIGLDIEGIDEENDIIRVMTKTMEKAIEKLQGLPDNKRIPLRGFCFINWIPT